jgi:hypothetical protein
MVSTHALEEEAKLDESRGATCEGNTLKRQRLLRVDRIARLNAMEYVS